MRKRCGRTLLISLYDFSTDILNGNGFEPRPYLDGIPEEGKIENRHVNYVVGISPRHCENVQ